MREWLDALIIAFVLAMFIRTFVVELFKIPSGSMSPTLLGDYVAEGSAVDTEGQTYWYLLIQDRQTHEMQVFRKDNRGHYLYQGRKMPESLSISQRDLFDRVAHVEEHRIFVNKFAYWFSKPDRADIVVFRVPFKNEPTAYMRDGHPFQIKSYNRNQGVYVKRAVAFDGELVQIGDDGRLIINGKPVTDPKIFDVLRYLPRPENSGEFSVKVQPGQMFVFGDNTDNSLDSRYWDGVPYENLRGKAFFRYWPVSKLKFLN